MRLVLASSSPRRRRLLRELVPAFAVRVPRVEERLLRGEAAAAHVRRLAIAKAREVVARTREGCVLGADTVVVLGGRVLGKPRDARDAERMLARLSGRTHEVLSGIAVVAAGSGKARSRVVRSRVTMRRLDAAEIRRYVASGEPMDKAGAYAVQGRGRRLVESVAGSLTNVVGLPLEALAALLAACGVTVAPRARRALERHGDRCYSAATFTERRARDCPRGAQDRSTDGRRRT